MLVSREAANCLRSVYQKTEGAVEQTNSRVPIRPTESEYLDFEITPPGNLKATGPWLGS